MALIRKDTKRPDDDPGLPQWEQPPTLPGKELVLASTFDCLRPVWVINHQAKKFQVFSCNLGKGHADDHETFFPHEGRHYYWTSTRPYSEPLKTPIPEGESSDLKERKGKDNGKASV